MGTESDDGDGDEDGANDAETPVEGDGDHDDRVYYVISDLHIGGDEQLEEIEFLDELLAFLERLEETDENAELVINGDAFGLWEFTRVDGAEKFDVLEETYPELFEQFRSTGENIPITLLPGNHDHELAAYDEFVERFAEYNVTLVQEKSITRPVGDQAIHFEHGHQQDSNNRIEDWGNPHATPLGYYYNTLVTSRAGQLSNRGRYNWLKDVQAVTPTERMPIWLFSKYFYREMNPLIRYSLVPFLLLFNISALLAVLSGLHLAGIWTLPVEQTTTFLGRFGTAGTAAWFLLLLNVGIAGMLVLIGIPLYFVRRDIRKTINRFGVFETELTVDPTASYEETAREIFASEPETTIFCFGHTHRPMLKAVNGGVLVNTGTWLKRLHRRDGIIGILPPVFYPSYQLAAVRIAAEPSSPDAVASDSAATAADGDADETASPRVTVGFEQITKPSPASEELTRTERFFTVGREPEPDLPEHHVVNPSEQHAESTAESVSAPADD